jgi:hypothetical protein
VISIAMGERSRDLLDQLETWMAPQQRGHHGRPHARNRRRPHRRRHHHRLQQLGIFTSILFFPWTILLYTLVWGPVNGVHGAGWIAVVVRDFLDVATYSARAAQSRYQARGV